MTVVNEWYITSVGSPYDAPETLRLRLAGVVNDPESEFHGKHIISSPIAGFEGERGIRTQNSLYQLGTVRPSYESVYPDAFIRLKEALCK
jgi:hypothetical protein